MKSEGDSTPYLMSSVTSFSSGLTTKRLNQNMKTITKSRSTIVIAIYSFEYVKYVESPEPMETVVLLH